VSTSLVTGRSLFLIGARGTGKSTLGPLLAGRLRLNWCDADVLLEQRCGRSIRQIFVEEGEAGFRDREALLLQELAQWPGHVIATGGGIVLRAENRVLLRRGPVVWLTAPAAVLWQRLQTDPSTTERRPNLAGGGLAEVEELLAVRTPLYAQCADLTVDTVEHTPDEAIQSIATWYENLPPKKWR
jgi:shikimate kinase